MMRSLPSMLKAPLLVVIAASAFSQSSFAAPLNLNYEATSSGTQNYNLPIVDLSGTMSTSSHYGNTLPSLLTAIPTTSFEFYDDYVFSISDANVNSVTATIDLGNLSIADLSVRLFSWQGNAEQSGGVTLQQPATGPSLQAWTTPLQPGGPVSGEVAVFNKSSLAVGSYVLQVRGNVTGDGGGSYAGTLNVTPVPLPAALPLLLSGLGMLGGLVRRQKVA